MAREDGAPVTQYHEDKLLYKRRRAPRRLRRRMRGKSKSFLSSYIKYSAPQRVLRTYSTTLSALANTQNIFAYMCSTMYNNNTVLGLGGSQGDDFYQLCNTILPSEGVASTASNNRLLIQHSHMDVMFSNPSTNTTSSYLEIFYIRCRKPTIGSPISDFNQIDTTKWAGEGSVNAGTIGIVPYDSHRFCEHWVIEKTRRIILPPGQVTEISMSNRRKKFFDPRRLFDTTPSSSNVFGQPGFTYGILVLVMGANLDTTNHQPVATGNIDVYVNKSYSVVIPPGANAITTGSL